MKLRTNKNSIRLRLNQSEVEQFKSFGMVSESIAFTGLNCNNLQYSLIQANHERISVNFLNNHLRVYVPVNIAERWCTSEDVGFDTLIDLPDDSNLYVLVEKDFKCLQVRNHEDESDNFDNPKQQLC
jgi:hypothetical protein